MGWNTAAGLDALALGVGGGVSAHAQAALLGLRSASIGTRIGRSAMEAPA